MLGYDEKRIHYLHRMYHAEAGFLASTIEWMTLHVDLKRRRVGPMPQQILARLAEVMASHAGLPLPDEAGRVMRRPAGPAQSA